MTDPENKDRLDVRIHDLEYKIKRARAQGDDFKADYFEHDLKLMREERAKLGE
ncbi:hypothetical protein ACFYYB_28060 [Streptomyces sp. NPDC002886]|uniref:hypothetical protein n=1 Tax=Streptomyces sp. NPDC002886 TaxID=3364667 RepID=UPI003699C487